MKLSLLELIEIEKSKGYSDDNASAKVCQDLILEAIANSPFNRNVTIKGGVVMRAKTHNVRRATQDLDIDFIKHSLTSSSIDEFIDKLNTIEGVIFVRNGDIEDLNQQDYHGKRAYILVKDNTGFQIISKIDFGVNKKIEIEQEEYCFDISYAEGSISLLINSSEQIFTEKLRSLLKFGPFSTRYKDIFDMYYLINHIEIDKILICLNSYIYQDSEMRESDINDIYNRVKFTFNNRTFQRRIKTTDKKWIDENIEDILIEILAFFRSLQMIKDI